MKLSVYLLFVYVLTSVEAEENSTLQPQPLVGLQSLETNLKIKNDLFERFIKLLFSGAVTTKAPILDVNEDRSSLFTKSFRRLNIFGLQSQPEDPTETSDGRFQQPPRNIFRVTKKPEDQLTPSFSVVSPTSFINIRAVQDSSHYPKLSLDQIGPQRTDASFQADLFKGPIADVQ